MKELIGKKINKVYLDSEKQQYISFDTDSGLVSYEAEGDCCSESWFYQITGLDALKEGTVSDVEEVDRGEVEDGKSRQEVDQLYSIKIKTDKGRADIEFRNSSNGCYGGSLELIKQLPDTTKMAEVTDDYHG